MYPKVSSLLVIFLLSSVSIGQQKPATNSAKAKAPAAVKPAVTSDPAAMLPSEETVNSFLQQMFGYDSSLTWKVQSIRPAAAAGLSEVTVIVSNSQGQQSNKFFVTPDGQHAVLGDVIPFGPHPFEADRKKLEQGINGASRGPATASVTLVEFSDLQCPHCKTAQPTLDKLLSEEPNVRFVMQNFPLPSHDWAAKAANYADCVGRNSNDAFWKFVEGTYAAQEQITAANADEKLTGIADAAGVKGTDIAACAAKPETASRIEHSVALGKSVAVNSTPTLFINGRNISLGGLPYEVLKKLVEFAAKPGK